MSKAKSCIKIGKKSSQSTQDFLNIFGVNYSGVGRDTLVHVNGMTATVMSSESKDALIVEMANTIMELTSKGKFSLREF